MMQSFSKTLMHVLPIERCLVRYCWHASNCRHI